jgi:hypothetical protein
MSRAALSIFVYGCYLVILSLTLFLIPNIALQIVGLDAHKDVWIFVVAMSVLFLAGYFIVAARKEVTEIFWLSVVFRLSVPLFFGLFIALGFSKVNLLLFTPPDVLFALWTLLALRSSPRSVTASA